MQVFVSRSKYVCAFHAYMMISATFGTANTALAESKSRTVGTVDRLDPELDQLVPSDAKMEIVCEGLAWCESPVWVPDGQFLLFSDIPNNAIMRWDAKSGCKLFLKPS